MHYFSVRAENTCSTPSSSPSVGLGSPSHRKGIHATLSTTIRRNLQYIMTDFELGHCRVAMLDTTGGKILSSSISSSAVRSAYTPNQALSFPSYYLSICPGVIGTMGTTSSSLKLDGIVEHYHCVVATYTLLRSSSLERMLQCCL